MSRKRKKTAKKRKRMTRCMPVRSRGRASAAVAELPTTLQILQAISPWEWPEHARACILTALEDDSLGVTERIIAADLAGDGFMVDDELAGILLAICRNPDEPEELRGRAVIVLGPALEYGDATGFDDHDDDLMISEACSRQVQEELREIHGDVDVPVLVRRRALEAAVRAPRVWQVDVVRAAHASDDIAWRVTAIFCMGFLPGFEREILELLDSADGLIHHEAVCAAGHRGLDAAWPHVVSVLSDDRADKSLLLAAIESAASIRPGEVGAALIDLTDSDDEDIVEAVQEAMTMAGLAAELQDDPGQ